MRWFSGTADCILWKKGLMGAWGMFCHRGTIVMCVNQIHRWLWAMSITPSWTWVCSNNDAWKIACSVILDVSEGFQIGLLFIHSHYHYQFPAIVIVCWRDVTENEIKLLFYNNNDSKRLEWAETRNNFLHRETLKLWKKFRKIYRKNCSFNCVGTWIGLCNCCFLICNTVSLV